jgi:hypothetical protein
MSGHGDHDGAHSADGHDHDDHDDHHAAPVLEEPATPLWLSILGVGLFLTAGILFLATRPEGKTTAELTAAPNAEGAAAAPAAGAGGSAPNPAPARMVAPPNPPGSPQPAVRPAAP